MSFFVGNSILLFSGKFSYKSVSYLKFLQLLQSKIFGLCFEANCWRFLQLTMLLNEHLVFIKSLRIFFAKKSSNFGISKFPASLREFKFWKFCTVSFTFSLLQLCREILSTDVRIEEFSFQKTLGEKFSKLYIEIPNFLFNLACSWRKRPNEL